MLLSRRRIPSLEHPFANKVSLQSMRAERLGLTNGETFIGRMYNLHCWSGMRWGTGAFRCLHWWECWGRLDFSSCLVRLILGVTHHGALTPTALPFVVALIYAPTAVPASGAWMWTDLSTPTPKQLVLILSVSHCSPRILLAVSHILALHPGRLCFLFDRCYLTHCI